MRSSQSRRVDANPIASSGFPRLPLFTGQVQHQRPAAAGGCFERRAANLLTGRLLLVLGQQGIGTLVRMTTMCAGGSDALRFW
jgi:hypothetical protein